MEISITIGVIEINPVISSELDRIVVLLLLLKPSGIRCVRDSDKIAP